jgi:hypothetical protein
MADGVDDLQHSWIKQRRGEIEVMSASWESRERVERDGQVDGNLLPRCC